MGLNQVLNNEDKFIKFSNTQGQEIAFPSSCHLPSLLLSMFCPALPLQHLGGHR